MDGAGPELGGGAEAGADWDGAAEGGGKRSDALGGGACGTVGIGGWKTTTYSTRDRTARPSRVEAWNVAFLTASTADASKAVGASAGARETTTADST